MYANGKVTGSWDDGWFLGEDTDSIASEALVILLALLSGATIHNWLLFLLITIKLHSDRADQRNTYANSREKSWSLFYHVRWLCSEISTLGLLGITAEPEACSPGKHQVLKNNLYDTLHICHMLKLARNALGDMGSFIAKDGQKIKWQCIRKLSQFLDEIGLHTANKLTRMYYFFRKIQVLLFIVALKHVLGEDITTHYLTFYDIWGFRLHWNVECIMQNWLLCTCTWRQMRGKCLSILMCTINDHHGLWINSRETLQCLSALVALCSQWFESNNSSEHVA